MPRSARKPGLACQATSASRQEARSQPLASLGRIVEQRRDPVVEQVAMLAEAVLAAAGVARFLDQRVELADVSASSCE